MATQKQDDYYPTIREALFGNGHTANLYCAVKYFLWHLFHLMFVIIGGLFAAGFIVAMLFYRATLWAAARVKQSVSRFNDSTGVSQQTRTTVKTTLDSVSTKPVTRRVYNYCPVDLKQDPKWFEGISAFGKSLLEKAEPPEYEWACDGCGKSWGHEPHIECWCQDHTEWVKQLSQE